MMMPLLLQKGNGWRWRWRWRWRYVVWITVMFLSVGLLRQQYRVIVQNCPQQDLDHLIIATTTTSSNSVPSQSHNTQKDDSLLQDIQKTLSQWNHSIMTTGNSNSHNATRGSIQKVLEELQKKMQQIRSKRGDESMQSPPSSKETSSYFNKSLYSLWKELKVQVPTDNNNTPTRTRTIANVVPRTRLVQYEQVTLLTHLSVTKLERLPLLHQFWGGGPISCAVWLTSEEDITTFYSFLNDPNNLSLLQDTSFHVYMEYTNPNDNHETNSDSTNNNHLYPHNTLRNMALQYSDSLYFVTNDVDMVPKPNTYHELMTLLATTTTVKDKLHQKALFVLPVFDQIMSPLQEEPPITTTNNNYMRHHGLPTTKEELIRMVQQTKQVEIFHQQFHWLHGATNYKKWFQNPNNKNDNDNGDNAIYYPIDYRRGYEPYVLGYRHGIPRYWEAFRGFGYNKQSWVMECHAAGYQFYVLRPFFLVHRWHKVAGHQNTHDKRTFNEPVMEQFDTYLQQFYNYQGDAILQQKTAIKQANQQRRERQRGRQQQHLNPPKKHPT